ncbi:DUF2726 domain-containing protein [Halomonas sp. KO116]|uniref:DUF2726 domain-containing protein n=1 Tax=Halomonas sp. KO116 TaxID=1504981 RepID=UPI0004E2BF8F|nr:DUF2726 domain-containing protein [Halomonas sp. KO116]AJY53126.1 protein of unknown function DUF2726 [Halomonas sp. KO116]
MEFVNVLPVLDALPLWAKGIPVFIFLFLLWGWLRKRSPEPSYDGRQYLFTKTEWGFYRYLAEAAGDQYLVMGKPRIADVLFVRKGQTRSDWARAFSRISSKHIDYIILDPIEGRIVAGVELDDPSHQRQDRQERDIFVNNAFAEAGIPLLRYPTASSYDTQLIAQDIQEAACDRLGSSQ